MNKHVIYKTHDRRGERHVSTICEDVWTCLRLLTKNRQKLDTPARRRQINICGLTLSENNIRHTNKFINQFTKMDVDLVRNIAHILLFASFSIPRTQYGVTPVPGSVR